MVLTVSTFQGQHQLVGDWPELEVANAFLDHLRVRGFSPATGRAYAFDLLNFGRFLLQLARPLHAVSAMDVFAWVDWQSQPSPASAGKVVALRPRSVAPATVNRRVAAVRGLFEFLVMRQEIAASPVPARAAAAASGRSRAACSVISVRAGGAAAAVWCGRTTCSRSRCHQPTSICS